MTILDEIAAKTRLRVEKAKKAVPLEKLRKLVDSGQWTVDSGERLPFERALKAPGLSFICEVKKASPSKGIIAEDFPWLEIAKEYEAAGAAAISVLTEPEYFLGADQYLQEISAAVSIPTLRKDFTIDPYQIYEAKLLGAGAVLLICALLDTETLASFIKLAEELGLSALVEAHNAEETEQALEAGAGIIGINNRNLKTFAVDIEAGARLRELIPSGILSVAESGIKSAEDTSILKSLNFDAVLIGESLMRSKDKKQFLKELNTYKENL
ncbi:MAG: indole-3-glycerol phosphate synthase TrpC [Treponema sp.]|nr:indole-3-glycerol phosphate synthase TrpC [Treponema sp.]